MTLMATLLLGIGILLVYSAVTNKKPVDVVKEALQGKVAGSLPGFIPLQTSPIVSDPLLVGGKWVLPVASYQITARYGDRGSRWTTFHTGLDFAAPVGTAVFAVGDGTITDAAWSGSYGYRMKERLSDGTVLYYAHLSQMLLNKGQKVSAGTQIGKVGVTGNTTGPHLHFEVRPNGGVPVDPEKWLASKGLNV